MRDIDVKIVAWIVVALAWSVMIWLWLIPAPARGTMPSNRYHGADAITEGWDGKVTAYQWKGGAYRVMWVRRGA